MKNYANANTTGNCIEFGPSIDVTSTTDGGGQLLYGAEVILCFWGSFWSNIPAPSPSSDDYKKAIEGLISGSYLSYLFQYRELGGVSLIYTDINDSSDPANGYTNEDVKNMLISRFQNTSMPEPQSGRNRLYMVIMPNGIKHFTTHAVGQHQSFIYNNINTYYAWVGNPGTFTGGNCVTKVFSHELVEALTNPNVENLNNGILVNGTKSDGTPANNEEIGDACNSKFAKINLNGIECTIQSYWSKEDNVCVLPVNPPKSETLEIKAIRKGFSEDLRKYFISRVKAKDSGGNTYLLSRNEVIELIETNGNAFYSKGADGSKANVFVERDYIRTVSDNSLEDNLLSLPQF